MQPQWGARSSGSETAVGNFNSEQIRNMEATGMLMVGAAESGEDRVGEVQGRMMEAYLQEATPHGSEATIQPPEA